MSESANRYEFRKAATAWRLVQLFSNWPVAFCLWILKRKSGEHRAFRLRMRSGLSFCCREGTSDWNTLLELLVADEYRLAFDYLENLQGEPVVLDLGANIGLFSLMCAHRHNAANIRAYEPAPPNCEQFIANVSFNGFLAHRVKLEQAAVGPVSGEAHLSYEMNAPASANIFRANGGGFTVAIRSFKDVLERMSGRVQLCKIDIEGAEYDLLRGSDRRLWDQLDSIALELHDDPSGQMSRSEFVEEMSNLGFRARSGPFMSLMLTR